MHTHRRRVKSFAYGIAVTIMAVVAWSATASGSSGRVQLTKVSINTASASAEWADIYVAQDEGFFAKQGLDVTTILATSEPGTVLLSGQAQFSSGTPTTTYIDDSAGAKLSAIYSPGATYVAWDAKSDIKTPADLKGKTLGVFSLQDLDVIYTTEMMSQYGVPPSDYTMRAIGFSSAKLAAVKAGAVAAAPLYPPTNFAAQADGLHQIFDTSQLKGGALPTFYIVKAAWGASHRTEVVGFLKALNQAHTWLFNPANKAKAIAIIVKHTQLPADQAQKSYALFFTKPGLNYSKAGEWNPTAVQAVVPGLIKLKLLKKSYPYASTVDLSYLKAAGK
jgi:ABC-type nitrate/sulfonate/bicarbonate transport system substrate-binding protein